MALAASLDQPARRVKVYIPHRPRMIQRALKRAVLHEGVKHALCVWHRRAGKTVQCIDALINAALVNDKPDPRYAYISPLLKQAKRNAWIYLDRFTRGIPGRVLNRSELTVTFPNTAQIQLLGGDDPDSIRGAYLDGCVLDEFAQLHHTLRPEVILPMLADRQGWEIVIGTPAGQNAFHALHLHAMANPDTWFHSLWKESQTRELEDGPYLDTLTVEELRRELTVSQYEQEMECSFIAPVLGSYYGTQIEQMENDKRITNVPHQTGIGVTTAWDLGIADSTAIWFVQVAGQEVHLIDYYESEGEGLQHYANVLQQKGYVYKNHIAPHDIAARELGSGVSRQETARNMGINFEVAPNLSVADGVEAARNLLSRCWADEAKTKDGMAALRAYRVNISRTGERGSTPLHDWASHGADAFRMLAVALKTGSKRAVKNPNTKWMV